jgi:hypothetical protein
MTTSQIIMKAMHNAKAFLTDYLDPGPHDCEPTKNPPLDLLDIDEVGKAVAFVEAEMLMRRTLSDY